MLHLIHLAHLFSLVHTSHSRQLVIRKTVTRTRSETSEKVDRSGPFRKKQVQRWNQVKTTDAERWDVFAAGGSTPLLSGRPALGDAKSIWLSIEPTTKVVDGVLHEVYLVKPVSYWLELAKPPAGKDQDADEVERAMKVMKAFDTQERKKFEKFIGEKPEDEEPEGKKKQSKKRPRRAAREPEDALQVGENDWEGNEEFSDDDDALADDEEQQKDEKALDAVEDEMAPDEEEDKHKVKDKFAEEISRILAAEKDKLNDDDTLDAELQEMSEEDEEEMVVVSQSSSPSIPPTVAPAPTTRPLSRQDEIKAKIKDLFWRKEYVVKVTDVLGLFPKIKKGSEEYGFVSSALKDIADVRDGLLYLKMVFRK